MSNSESLSSSPDRSDVTSARKNAVPVLRRRANAKCQSPVGVKQFDGDLSSSSGKGGDESTGDGSTPSMIRIKKRKKRKRPSSSADDLIQDQEDTDIMQKVVEIELALVSLQEDHKQGIDRLKNLAITEGGLVHDYLRRRVWPKLLNIDLFETEVLPSQEEVEAHKDYNQVVLDVNRSLKRFPPGIADDDRPLLQDQLTRLIIRVLAKHPELHYYQGYHDVAITFLLVVGEHLGFHIVEKLSVGPWLKEFMLPTMERTNYLLQFIYPILQREDADLHDFLNKSEVGTIFALPWLITWFGHVLPHYSDVVRLYDFFIAQPPLMPIYLAAAIVLYKRDQVIIGDCDMASVHSLLSRIPVDAPFEKLLKVGLDLYSRYPPSELESDVELRVKILQDDLAERRKRVVNHYRSQKGPAVTNSAPVLQWTFRRVLFFAAPVLIGVVVWKYMNTESSAIPI